MADPASTGKKRPLRADLVLAVRLAWNFGYIIAIPAVLFGFGGAYLDKLWGTSPIMILIGFTVALALSGFGIWKKLKDILPR